MLDVATMRKLDPEQFSQAADGYHAIGSMADEAKGQVTDHIVGKMDKTLDGEAADAAFKALRGLGDNFHYTQTECGLVRAALNGLAAELRAAKRKFDAAEEDATAAKFTVNSDGSVTYPPGGDEVDGERPEGGTVLGSAEGEPTGDAIDPASHANSAAEAVERQAANASPNPNHGKAVAIANRLAEALTEATEADRKWAPKLRGLKADDDLHVSRRDWVDVTKDMRSVRKGAGDYLDPPKKGSPEANARWWKGLSRQERDDYVSLHPSSIGAMDGLPAEARDEANRTVLAETKAQYELEKSAIPPEPRNKETWITGGGGIPVKVPTDTFTLKAKRTTGWVAALAASLALMTALTGCGMADESATGSDTNTTPYNGTRRQNDVDQETAKVSSEILDLLTVKGKTSQPGPGVLRCDDKDRDKYFRMLHPWSLSLSKEDRPKLDEALKDLKEELPRHGWEIKSYGRDSSANRNLALTADHDKKKFSVNVVSQAKDDPPMLMVRVISACYKVPKGETVEHY